MKIIEDNFSVEFNFGNTLIINKNTAAIELIQKKEAPWKNRKIVDVTLDKTQIFSDMNIITPSSKFIEKIKFMFQIWRFIS